MKKHSKRLALVVSTTLSLFVTSNTSAQMNNDFKIDTVSSQKASVSQVSLIKTTEGYVLKGKVYNKIKNRSVPIPGHVDISIIDAEGKTIATNTASIHRISKKSRFAKFTYTLTESPVEGSSIRVRHHNAPLNVTATDLEHK